MNNFDEIIRYFKDFKNDEGFICHYWNNIIKYRLLKIEESVDLENIKDSYSFKEKER